MLNYILTYANVVVIGLFLGILLAFFRLRWKQNRIFWLGVCALLSAAVFFPEVLHMKGRVLQYTSLVVAAINLIVFVWFIVCMAKGGSDISPQRYFGVGALTGPVLGRFALLAPYIALIVVALILAAYLAPLALSYLAAQEKIKSQMIAKANAIRYVVPTALTASQVQANLQEHRARVAAEEAQRQAAIAHVAASQSASAASASELPASGASSVEQIASAPSSDARFLAPPRIRMEAAPQAYSSMRVAQTAAGSTEAKVDPVAPPASAVMATKSSQLQIGDTVLKFSWPDIVGWFKSH